MQALSLNNKEIIYIAQNNNREHFIKVFYFYELLIVFKKHIRAVPIDLSRL
jgi:hypothetical protein